MKDTNIQTAFHAILFRTCNCQITSMPSAIRYDESKVMFDVLLTVHLNISLVINQLNAQILVL